MDASNNESWFFSRDGVQGGPVTFQELRRKSQAGELSPRSDLVWTQGLPDWKPAGEIEGLFERRGPAELAAPASAAAAAGTSPYSPPGQESGAELLATHHGEWPGLRRRWYLLGAIGFPFLIGIVLGILEFQEITLDPTVRFGLEYVVATLVSLYVTLQRFPNLGMSRWWTFGLLVPFLNFWLGYRLFACPAGYQQNKKLDPPGITLAVIYWLMIALLILMIGIMVAVFSGAFGDAELRDAFMEALREAYPNLPTE
jgi:uncharacterized membrane protein YhaH (DUF805 family)